MLPEFGITGSLGTASGFFQFGKDNICWGKSSEAVSEFPNDGLFDAAGRMVASGNRILLPFDVDEVVDNLRYERYVRYSGWQSWVQQSCVRDLYYRLRPLFPVGLRKHLQKIYLSDWNAISFPNWPVDRTVDLLFEKLVVASMRAIGLAKLPFIWFWPEGYRACALITHDVETAMGRDFCDTLMDIDDSFGIKASFQVVPEKRYGVSPAHLQGIRDRGFEVNVHGLNHDGNLFQGRQAFIKKAAKINAYAAEFGSLGFRSPVLYRNIDWFQDLKFSYDMSVPNVARLEAQRGGCCTIMPYFLPGGVTELPLTTIEDYTLFHILKDYSTTLWKQQMRTIANGHGLMTFIVHPDYVAEARAQGAYKELLAEVNRFRCDHSVWTPLPRQVDQWWRERSAMTLMPEGPGWRIEGPGSQRARVAYAFIDGDRLTYELN